MRFFTRCITSIFLIIVLCSSLVIDVFPTQTPALSAECAVLMDADTGKLIYGRNADKRAPMASTTKIMTAVVALENLPTDTNVSIEAAAVGIEGSSAYLQEGEELTLEQLLYALLLRSANDAAVAIALAVSGSIEAFAVLMNEKAESLGLENTHFTNPHGLDDEAHYTSARDLALLTSHALKNNIFAEIVSTYKKTIPLGKDEGARLLVNHNKLLRTYDGAIGVKTGFTKRSGRCLVSAAKKGGLTLVAVTLNAPDDWHDHTQMLDYGFENYQRMRVFDKGDYSSSLSVVGGMEDFIIATNSNAIYATLPISASAKDLTVKTDAAKFLYAPIQKGRVIGKITVFYDGEKIGESELISTYDIGAQKPKLNLFQKIAAFILKIFK